MSVDHLPTRDHVNLWRRQARRMTTKALRYWQRETITTRGQAPHEVEDPTDTIIICNAILMAINEELDVRKGSDRKRAGQPK